MIPSSLSSEASPATVLLVEDDAATAYWVRRVLTAQGERGGAAPRVVHAATLADALAELARGGVDCVVLDLMLPDSEGIETFMAVQSAAPHVPVVLLTALEDEEFGAEAVRRGAEDFLPKTALPEQIARAVRYALLRAEWRGAVDEAARLDSVLDSITDAYVTVDGGGRVTYTNRAAEHFFGVRAAEVVGRAPEDAFPALAGSRTGALLVRGGGAAELEEYLPTMGRWVEVRLYPSRMGTTAYLRDSTSRRETEDALAEAQRFTSHLLSNLPGMVYRCANDARRTLEFASEGTLGLTGYPPERFIDPRGLLFGDIIHPDDRDWVLSEVHEAVAQRHPFELTYRIVAADGTEKWVWEQGRGVPDGDGVTRAVEGFISDITRQKTLEEQLRQAQKMDAVGRLAGGIAHDFNNLLTAITGTVSLMREDLAPGDPLRTDADAIAAAAERASMLARQLLAFGRGHMVRRQTLELNHVVEGTVRMLRRLVPTGMELSTVLAAELAPVSADAGQIEQVLMNLVLNARDALPPEGGQVILETMNVEVDAWPQGWATGLAPGSYVMLVVHDTGSGIDAKTQERIFEPFFTTKEVGKGTGLGLAIVYGIVKQSGGTIRVFSRPGAGTTFRVLLPRARELPHADAAPHPVPGGTVLVVDDEPTVRYTTRRLLERAGFTVIEAPDAAGALELGRSDRAIDLLLTDVMMPGMTGPELAAHFARARPSTPVLFISGYSEQRDFPGAAIADGSFLHKPFSTGELIAAVRGLLEKA